LDLSIDQSALQGFRRFAIGSVLLGIETGKMLSDDLVGAVPFEPFRPGIPGGNPAVSIQQKDGIFLKALDKQPHRVLALSQHSLVPGQSLRLIHHAVKYALKVSRSSKFRKRKQWRGVWDAVQE
jgi:hypothetical protein